MTTTETDGGHPVLEDYFLTKSNETHEILATVSEGHQMSATENQSIIDGHGGGHVTAVINLVQIVVSLSGFAANVVTLVTLWKNGEKFSNVTCLVLGHLAAIDACVCLVAGAYSVLPPVIWSWNHYYLDWATCYAWHSQLLYSVLVVISVWNLIVIAFERYIIVCHPLHRVSVSQKNIWRSFLCTHLVAIIVEFPIAFRVRFTKGTCVPAPYWVGGNNFFYSYFILSLFVTYLIPVMILLSLHVRIVSTLRMRSRSNTLQHSAIVDAAGESLIKTAIVVTSVFAVTIGIDRFYSVLGYTGVARYGLGTPLQKASTLVTAFNSVANPFIYGLMMPAFRLSLRQTLRCRYRSRCSAHSASDNVYTAGGTDDGSTGISRVTTNTCELSPTTRVTMELVIVGPVTGTPEH